MRRAPLIGIAWVAVLLASSLPFIIWRAFLRHNEAPTRISILQLAGLGLVLAASLGWSSVRSLRGMALALVALVLGDWIRYAIENTSPVVRWSKTAPQYQWIFLDSLIALIPGALMALTLVGSGLKRRDVFLVRGNLAAPSKMPLGLGPVRWSSLGPILIAVLSVPLAMQLVATWRPELSPMKKVIGHLPVILTFAIVNSASEEFRFRSVLLARIRPALGNGHALLLTSALFGLGHWFGHPSGPAGVVMAGFAGWLWGKSMIETNGFFWAWLIHGIQDVIILTFVVLAPA